MDEEEHKRLHREEEDTAILAFWKLVALLVISGGIIVGSVYLGRLIGTLL